MKLKFKRNVLSVCLLFHIFLFNGIFQNLYAQRETNILNGWLNFSDAPNSLNRYFSNEAYKLLDERAEAISLLNSVEAWERRKEEIRDAMWESLGSFPEKTPLNVRVTDKKKMKGFTLENIIYESLPGYYVTASLFIPDNIKRPAPAVLFCTGHSWSAYRRDIYQLPLLNLVKKGFIVLAFDPVGQGERIQYWDYEKEKSVFSSSTIEHSYPAPQAFLIGQSTARYFIWDGIRGIDYLVSRKEVDASRIGVHGLSGGGTQTAYISALDDRVVASAPAGYITGFRRLIESIGVQDGEQNLFHGLTKGIDHADYIVAMAPKPVLIMATTRDFFSIQGTRETFDELKRTYGYYGKSENIQLVEDDYRHGYTRENREAMYAFFQKYLSLPGSSEEEDVEYLSEEELQKTASGQLITSLGGETMFSLNRKEYQSYSEKLQSARDDNFHEFIKDIPEKAKMISGYVDSDYTMGPIFAGCIEDNGCNIEKYFIVTEGDFAIPYLLMIPEQGVEKAILYIHPNGKAGIIEEREDIKKLTDDGFTIIAPDLPGLGELMNLSLKGDAFIDNISYNVWFTATITGTSIIGLQSSEVVRLINIFKRQFGITEIYGIAHEEVSPILLHAAAFEPAILKVALIKPYISYRSVVQNQFYKSKYVHSFVPGALVEYDLPDLMATLAPRKLLVTGVVNSLGQYMIESDLNRELEVVSRAYRLKKAENQLQISTKLSYSNLEAVIKEWLK